MPAKARESLRKQVIEMVLATDMKQHFSQASLFRYDYSSGFAGVAIQVQLVGTCWEIIVLAPPCSPCAGQPSLGPTLPLGPAQPHWTYKSALRLITCI